MSPNNYLQNGGLFDGREEIQGKQNTEATAAAPVIKSGGQTRSVMKNATKTKAADAFKTISEVSELLDVQQHVLRFWETKFSYVRPLKRGGGRRYYRPEDVELLKSIHKLLYTEGYTIKGVQKLLREKGKNFVVETGGAKPSPAQTQEVLAQKPGMPQSYADLKKPADALSESQRHVLRAMLDDLKEIRRMIGKDE